jgi:16S rRNA (guanine(966)-N(2))-methyltransferase RsmD
MRIIAGEYKSRLIDMPKGVEIRPTQDKVREAVFNILAGSIQGSNALDLYAGSGAFGLEALSRGARRAVFVDESPKCVNVIKKNVERLRISDERVVILRLDSIKALKTLEGAGEEFDLVFLDPPYHRDMAKKCLISITKYDILAPIHRIVVEHHKRDALGTIEDTRTVDERTYGDTRISIFEMRPKTPGG